MWTAIHAFEQSNRNHFRKTLNIDYGALDPSEESVTHPSAKEQHGQIMEHDIGLKTLTCRETGLTLIYVHIKHELSTFSTLAVSQEKRVMYKMGHSQNVPRSQCTTLNWCICSILQHLIHFQAVGLFDTGGKYICMVKDGGTKFKSDFKMKHFKAEVAIVKTGDIFCNERWLKVKGHAKQANLILKINPLHVPRV